MATRPLTWRILAVFSGPSLDTALSEIGSADGCIEELLTFAGSGAEVKVLRDAELSQVSEELDTWKPNLVYFTTGAQYLQGNTEAASALWPEAVAEGAAGILQPQAVADLMKGPQLDSVYFDCLASQAQAEAVREQGVANVVFYSKPAQALHGCQFAHAFFATLRSMTAPFPEAFAVASHSAQAFCTTSPGGTHVPPVLPTLLSDAAPKLPNMEGIPLPALEGVDLSPGVVAAVPGWDSVRLLAPHAELKLLACSQPTLIDAYRLSFLGEALRAVLVLEMRTLTVTSANACARTPAHLPPGCTALRATIKSCSGAEATVVLGGPPKVLENPALVEHALRNTLVADALSLQFRLPPPNLPPPTAQSSPAIACGASAVETLVVNSVWAVHVLRTLCLNATFRGLVGLGVAAIGGSGVAAFQQSDAWRYIALSAADLVSEAAPKAAAPAANGSAKPVSAGTIGATGGPAGDGVPTAEGSVDLDGSAPATGNGVAEDKAAAETVAAGRRKRRRKGVPEGANVWKTSRPPMLTCTEKQFLNDLCDFMRERLNRKYDPDNFPDAILNGRRLDLFKLYKEVVRRGGYGVGNGINWKGQVFPAMRNYTSSNRMTGVGNALKRHYVGYLLDYEQAHPDDVTGDACAICGGSDDIATDWISCDMCESWVHFSCDSRPYLGNFKDYSKGQGQSYTCASCHDTKKRKAAAA
ncbi:hypothetical protein WJX73_007633 [Symbiochloris irregularis]|uniref:ARID domain-containing protein n=1 Tax=Symbiochloris irregularis TaxID=706552 RepID=A0AAW1NX11_9CHLO